MHLLVQKMLIRTKPKSGKQWVRESYEDEATAQDGMGQEKAFKLNGRAALEQVQDRIRTC